MKFKEFAEAVDKKKYKNVVGYSRVPQKKIKDGKETEVLAYRVYVTKKLPLSALSEEERIPEEIDGIPTDVVEIGELKALDAYTGRYRPAFSGVSTSRADQNAAGTIGWWMVDDSGSLYMISNNHVWTKGNNGKKGDALVQPGVIDGGNPNSDVIAALYGFVPIDTSGGENTVDVAVASPIDMKLTYVSIIDYGGVAGKRDVISKETVTKIGRTTGKTSGAVFDTSAHLQIGYDKGTAVFDDVFVVTSNSVITLPGDSGSPVVTADNKFAGLLFAGDTTGKVMVGCKQSNIEKAVSSALNDKFYILTANTPAVSPQPAMNCRKIFGSLYICQ